MARRVVAALCAAAAWALLPNQHTRNNPSLLSAKKTVWTFDEARDYARSFGFGSKDEYVEYRCPGAYALPRDPVAAFGDRWTSWDDYLGTSDGVEVVTRPGFEQVLFIEMGWGADQHGQNATKACVRAARNAIESTLCGHQPVRSVILRIVARALREPLRHRRDVDPVTASA